MEQRCHIFLVVTNTLGVRGERLKSLVMLGTRFLLTLLYIDEFSDRSPRFPGCFQSSALWRVAIGGISCRTRRINFDAYSASFLLQNFRNFVIGLFEGFGLSSIKVFNFFKFFLCWRVLSLKSRDHDFTAMQLWLLSNNHRLLHLARFGTRGFPFILVTAHHILIIVKARLRFRPRSNRNYTLGVKISLGDCVIDDIVIN